MLRQDSASQRRIRATSEEETRGHDVTARGRRGLRSASGRSSFDQPVALPQRLLARPGDDAGHDRPGIAILSDQLADLVAAGLAAGAGQAGLQPRRHEDAGARPFWCQHRHLQSAVRRADGVFRGHGGCVLPRAERLAGQGMARQGAAAARLDRDSRAERREVGGGNRALRQRPALRPGADAGDGRHARSANAPTGRSTPPPSGWDCRSASMPAAIITTRRPRSAGVPITSRIMSPRRRRSRPN